MLKMCPHFFCGRLRQCFTVALRERYRARQSGDIQAEERGLEGFWAGPNDVDASTKRNWIGGRDELAKRADDFARGRWIELFQAASETEAPRHTTVVRSETEDQVRKGQAALSRVRRGQLSRARQELTGAALAPKTLDTLAQLQGRRPQEREMEIPAEVMDHALFTKCLQSAPSGCAPDPGGCSNEMLRVCLDDCEVFQLLFRAAEDCASASMPESASKAFMSATMTALQKPDGGVRGIATGTSFRRLVAKTLARQFGKAVESSCAPFQFALSTRVGTDCVGHVVRALTDENPMVTVLSIDGVGACDHV